MWCSLLRLFLTVSRCTGRRACDKGLLTGLKMKSEEDQGFFVDDTAANDLEMQCNHSTTTMTGGGNHWGYYSNWATCPEGKSAIH